MSQNHFSISGTNLLFNDRPFKIIGLRLSNALISDRIVDQTIAYLDLYKSCGVNTISVFLMGSRFGDIKGYLPDGSLDSVYADRLGRIIEAADVRGMVVLVGCLYWSVSRAKEDLVPVWTQDHANRAIANTVRWLKQCDYRNVFVDPDNEGMACVATGWSIGQMIDAAHEVDSSYMIAHNRNEDPPDNADLLLHHSPRVPGRPWVQSEGTPHNAPGGYWHDFSKREGHYNYIRIGRYTRSMIDDQLRQTAEDIERFNGHILASTWLQCGPGEGIDGPFLAPGRSAGEDAGIDEEIEALQASAGVLWWLEHVRERYGSWEPPRGRQGDIQHQSEEHPLYGSSLRPARAGRERK
jgi:hypothetical protein